MEAHSRAGATWRPGYPIIVDSRVENSAIASPAALQRLLGLSKAPDTVTTRFSSRSGHQVGHEVIVAEIDVYLMDSLPRFAEIAETSRAYVWYPDSSVRSIGPRRATIIESIRETPIEKKACKWRCWSEAVAAFSRGEQMPEPRYPIMIHKPGEETPLTPERLKKLIKLPDVPKVTKATITDSIDGHDDMEVEIVDVSPDEYFLLRERTEFDTTETIWFSEKDTGENQMRSVMMVKSIRDKWLASIEWEERLERDEHDEDDRLSMSSG